MTVPEGHARYAVIEGFGPGGAGLTITTETVPAGAFQVDQLLPNWDPKPPVGACLTIRIAAKQPGSGKIRLLFGGNDYSEPLPVQVPPDASGTVRSLQDAYQLSNRALIKAKERLEKLRNSMVAATGSMPFQANWDSINQRYLVVANVLNLPDADLQPGQVSLSPKQKALFATAIPTITGALDRIIKSINLWGTGETPFLMRSDLESNFAHVYGLLGMIAITGSRWKNSPLATAVRWAARRRCCTNAFISPERSTGRTSLRESPSHRRGTKLSRTRFAVWIMLRHWRIWSAVWPRS